MYMSKKFSFENDAAMEKLISDFPFAMVVVNAGRSLISHIPIIRSADGYLFGHVDLANPISGVEVGSDVSVVFRGPHAYVSPRYYESEVNVPTWNFAAVECAGKLAFVDDGDVAWGLMGEMVERFEGKDGWGLPDEIRFRGMLKAVRFFRIDDVEMSGILKFNQNKSEADIEKVIGSLRGDGQDGVARFMGGVFGL